MGLLVDLRIDQLLSGDLPPPRRIKPASAHEATSHPPRLVDLDAPYIAGPRVARLKGTRQRVDAMGRDVIGEHDRAREARPGIRPARQRRAVVGPGLGVVPLYVHGVLVVE